MAVVFPDPETPCNAGSTLVAVARCVNGTTWVYGWISSTDLTANVELLIAKGKPLNAKTVQEATDMCPLVKGCGK